MTTAETIKNARKALGLSTAQFGDAVGMSGRSVEDWEQGRRRPSGAVLKMVSVLLARARKTVPKSDR